VENFAKRMGFDPLIPEGWYSVYMSKFLGEKVIANIFMYLFHMKCQLNNLGWSYPYATLQKCKKHAAEYLSQCGI
jgi:hypothetical protein